MIWAILEPSTPGNTPESPKRRRHNFMITTTHIVTNAHIARRWAAKLGSPRAFIVGGFAPDIGLTLMTVGAAIVLPRTRGMSVSEAMKYSFDDLFFNSKPWIAAANVLHSPVVVGALFLASGSLSGVARDRLRSFSMGAALHIAMDVPVHVDDGPVIFWPLNWNYRIESPLSYYDADHYGNIIAPIDVAITVIGGAALLVKHLAGRKR